MLALDDIEAADAGADVDTDAIGDLVGDLEAGVLHRFVRRGQGEVNEAAHLAGLFLIHELKGIEVLDLGGEADGVAGEIEGFDLAPFRSCRPSGRPRLQARYCRPRR